MTGRWRSAGLVLGLALLAGCGAAPSPKATASPSPTSGVAAVQTPGVAPTVEGIATTTEGSCKCSTVHLLSPAGAELGSVTFNPGVQPTVEGGAQGIYYLQGYQLLKLGTDGATTTVGTVAQAPTSSGATVSPDAGQGALAVAPGGTEWAYLQAVTQGRTETEQVWLGEANQAPKLLLSSVVTSSVPASEFPNGWSYQLLGWEDGSLVLAQLPSGTNTFVSTALEVSLVNPQTGVETLISNSQNCPISAIASTGGYVCFQQGGGQATEVVTGIAGISTGAWSLPAGSGYGAAFFSFSGKQILFANCEGCAASPSTAYLSSQMEILDIATGSIRSIGAPGLVPDAWLPNGQIVATRYSQPKSAVAGAAPLSVVALVNPGTGQVTALTTGTAAQFAGLATS